MFDDIKWLFFDIGSTLIDESECYKNRYLEIIKNTDITYEEFVDKVIDFSKYNQNGDHPAADFFGLTLPKWNKALEKLYPDTVPVLSVLSQKYKIGVIANQSFGTAERLKNWGILKYIDVLVASAEEGIAKPNPEIFNIALSRAKCDVQNAIMIGDRLDNDIVPANIIGMKSIWIKQGFAVYQTPKSKNETADYTVNSLSELLRVL